MAALKHPLQDLAAVTARQRIRAAVGSCAGVDPDEHAERVLARVLQVRAPDLAEDQKARAATLAREDGTLRLVTERSIA